MKVLYFLFLKIKNKKNNFQLLNMFSVMQNNIPRIGSRKSACRIPKGVIHIQASFNNIIVTVIGVWDRVVSWSSVGTCGFRGTRRGMPFAAQTIAKNAIRSGSRYTTSRSHDKAIFINFYCFYNYLLL